MRPFLTVVTRCYKRPMMLRINKHSLVTQTSQDYEQKFIIDRHGLGVSHANRALAGAPATGRYVMVLDDDDKLTDNRAIEWLKEETEDRPELVIFRVDHGEKLGILPDDLIWGKRPLKGHIGSCSFISRCDIWDRYIHRFGDGVCGDYAYLHAVWKDRPDVVWFDKVLAGVQRVSKGQPE